MLKALHTVGREQGQVLLSDMVLNLPGRERLMLTKKGRPLAPEEIRDIRTGVLSEIREELSIDVNDTSTEARSRINGAIADEIGSLVLHKRDRVAVRGRLGSRGILHPTRYTATFKESFGKMWRRGGAVTKPAIKNVVRHPDAYEHVPASEWFGQGLSLFAGHSFDEHVAQNTLLVGAAREGTELSVHFAITVVHAALSGPSPPVLIELLRAWVDRFGVDIQVGPSRQRERLVLNRLFETPAPGARPAALVRVPRSGAPTRGMVIYSFMARSDGMIEVPFAFAVDDVRYVDSLREYGLWGVS